MDTSPVKKKFNKKIRRRKPSGSRSQVPPMAKHGTKLGFGRVASGGASAPQPPRATEVGPEFHGFCPFADVYI